MRIGDARIDFEGNIIHGVDGPQIVEPKIMQLLKVLSESPNQVFSREDLITAVWGVDFGGDERLSRAISLLRKALGEKKGARRYIETISRRGYRLIADVSESPSPVLAKDFTDIPGVTIPAQSDPYNKPRKGMGFRWILGGFMGAGIASIAILFFSPNTVIEKNAPVSESLAAGFENIQFFGHENSVMEAQDHFKSVLKQDPESAAAHAGLALAYIREYTSLESDPALLKQARASALNAFESNEHLALSHIAMGWSAAANRDFDKASQYLERADLLDKDNPLILEGRLRVLGSLGQFPDARRLLARAMELHPENGVFPPYAAQLSLVDKDLETAEKYARRSIKIDPQNPWNYSLTAQILHLQDRTPEAIKIVQDGLTINDSASLYNNLGTYLFFQGYYELAASAYEKTLEKDGNAHDPLFWANLGDAYRWVPNKENLSRQKYDRALQLWEEDLKDAPEDKTLLTRIALYQSKLQIGEKPEALLNSIAKTEDLPGVLYYRMLVTAELWGERHLSLDLLEKSINSGYPLTEIRNDPELKALREDQAYHLIVSQKAR